MAKKRTKNKFRFLNLSNAAKELDSDAGIMSRGIASGRIPGGEKQVYVKAEDENGDEQFFEVGHSTIKVVDMDQIETEEVRVVKFRRKGPDS